MFGAPDKGKIKEAFIGFRKRLAVIEISVEPKKVNARLGNIEQLIKDLSQAFD